MNYKAAVFTFSECVESDQSVPAYGKKGPGLTGEELINIQDLIVNVKKGKKVKIGEITFKGAEKLNPSLLEKALKKKSK